MANPNSENQGEDSRAREFPLSHGQQALWFLQRLNPTSCAYHLPQFVRIPVDVQPELMEATLRSLVARHPVMRTTFHAGASGEPVQRVHDSMDGYLHFEDATEWTGERLDERVSEEVYRPFDLERGPLFHLWFFRRGPAEFFCLVVFHHLIVDLWSFAIFMHEISAFYSQEKTGKPAELRPVRSEYHEYVASEAAMLAGEEGERLWGYWRERLSGQLPVLQLPLDRVRPSVPTYRGSSETRSLGPVVKEGVETLARAYGTLPISVMAAAYQVLLHRYTGQTDIIVGSPKACRTRRFGFTFGYFINTVPLRTDCSGDPAFGELLRRAHASVSGGFEHGEFPFSLMVQRLHALRDPARPPIYQVVLAWQKTTRLVGRQMSAFALAHTGGLLGTPEFPMESRPLKFRASPFDLTLLIAESDEDYGAAIEYSRDVFEAGAARRMLGHLKTLLEAAIRDPHCRVSELPLLEDEERERMLTGWNRTAEEGAPAACIHEWFEEQAARTPDRTALVFGEERLTYQELNRRANRLARYLRVMGVGPEVLAGICLERSVDMIVALLAVLKAGGAYVPLDPSYPPQRLRAVVEEAALPVLVTASELAGRFPCPGTRVIVLDGEAERITAAGEDNPPRTARPQNLAYAIFTSGSTGRPKGVLLQHRGLVNLVWAQTRGFGLEPDSRVLQFASFSFDASVSEIFMALATGAALYLAPRETLINGPELLRLMRAESITAITLPPSLLSVLPAVDLPRLKILISAGEACSWDVAGRWAPGRRFFNAYGPTEATIGPSYYEVGAIRRELATVPVGRPIANTRLYVLDRKMQPVPVGVAGELHVGGVGLARGYLGRPGLTAASFVPDPFSGEPGARLYRTGDLARFLPDGCVECLGRIDHQVKVRGFRVEPGEIEAALERHPAVREAVVVARSDGRADPYLAAYVVPRDRRPAADELRAHLRESLPEYMTPSRFVLLEKLPLTANGKVDRKALPDPVAAGFERGGGFAAPVSGLERTIASVWAEVLGVPEVGTNDNFFDLGGHSLALARVHAALEGRLSRSLPLTDLFRYPTVKALAASLSQAEAGGADAAVLERAGRQRQALERQRQRRAGHPDNVKPDPPK